MRNARLAFALIAATMLAVGCSSSSSGGSDGGGGGNNPGSCNAGKVACSGTNQPYCCADYAGNFTATTVQNDCNISAGMYSANVCASANRIGSCTLYKGTAAEKTIRYYTGYMGDPSGGCTNIKGVWTPN